MIRYIFIIMMFFVACMPENDEPVIESTVTLINNRETPQFLYLYERKEGYWEDYTELPVAANSNVEFTIDFECLYLGYSVNTRDQIFSAPNCLIEIKR